MKPVRIMHFADTHFGVENYGRPDPETGLNSRLADFRRTLDFAINAALKAGIDLALFGGDAYKTRDPNQTQQREFAQSIRKLTDAGVPVVMVTGNHDLPNSRSRANAIEIYRTLGIDNVRIISKPEVIKIDTKNGPVQVAGLPYLLRSTILSKKESTNKTIVETTDMMVEKYGEYIEFLAGKLDPEIPSVLLGHFWLKNAKVSSQGMYLNVSEPEILVSTAANPAFDYVAMGHIHKFQELNKSGSPPVVYSGSIERIDFSETDEEKGFVLIDLVKGSAPYKFVPVPARRFVEIEADADTDDPTAAIIEAIGKEDVKDAVVKVVYRISQEKVPLVDEKEIREALSGAFMVVSINKLLSKESRATRNRLLNEMLSPVQALEMFFDTKEELKGRKAELLKYARPLIEEVTAEEMQL